MDDGNEFGYILCMSTSGLLRDESVINFHLTASVQ